MAEEESAGGGGAEVRVALVADDLSAAVIKGVVEGMRQVHEETLKAKEAAGEEKGLGSEILKAKIKFEALKAGAELVTEAIHQSYEMAELLADAALEAADNEDKALRAMSGSMFLMDQGKHSMAAIRDYAADTKEEMEKFGIQVGVSDDAMSAMFQTLISRGSMGTEQAKELTEQIAVVGKVVPGGMQSLADGMSMVEMGMVRARNPVVQLIAATHTLAGNAHQVAAAMQKMTPEEQMKLGQEAIEKQAKALGNVGQGLGAPSLQETKTSLEGVKEAFLESMGKPMEEALVPHLVALRDYLSQNLDRIEELGKEAGEAASKVIDYISDAVQGAYQGFQQDWGEITHLADEFKAAWSEIFGQAGDTRVQFRILADDLVLLFKGMLHAVEMANDLVHNQAIGTTEAESQRTIANNKALGAITPEGKQDFNREVKKYEELAKAMGQTDAATQAIVADMKLMAALRENSAQKADKNLNAGNYDKYSDYLDNSIKNQDDAATRYALHMLVGSKEAANVLAVAGEHITGGMDALMKVVADKAPELAKQLKASAPGAVGKEGIKPPAGIVFNGAHFSIKQDFLDQDPDRVVAVFKKDVAKSATNRIESRVSTPFGL